jgi:CheY-like chemotaxis protein
VEPARFAAPPALHFSSRPRVLLVDDEAVVRELVAEMLTFLGCDVDRAAGAREGIDLFGRSHYDLVVTDLSMPGLTGWDVIAAVRRHDTERGVILTTGTPMELERERAREARVTVLPKPFHLAALREAVEHALRRPPDPGTGAPGGGGRAPVERESMTQDAPARFSGELGAVIDAIRKTAGDLDVVAKATEVLLREHEGLQARLATVEREHQETREAHAALLREHEAVSAALAGLRGEHDALRREYQSLRAEHEAGVQALASARQEAQTLVSERQSAVDALETLVSRLRR